MRSATESEKIIATTFSGSGGHSSSHVGSTSSARHVCPYRRMTHSSRAPSTSVTLSDLHRSPSCPWQNTSIFATSERVYRFPMLDPTTMALLLWSQPRHLSSPRSEKCIRDRLQTSSRPHHMPPFCSSTCWAVFSSTERQHTNSNKRSLRSGQIGPPVVLTETRPAVERSAAVRSTAECPGRSTALPPGYLPRLNRLSPGSEGRRRLGQTCAAMPAPGAACVDTCGPLGLEPFGRAITLITLVPGHTVCAGPQLLCRAITLAPGGLSGRNVRAGGHDSCTGP